MGQDVVGIDLRQTLRDHDRLIVAPQILQSPRQTVHRFGKGRIGGQRLLIGRDGLFQVAVGHQVERGIVLVFGFLASVGVRHARKSSRQKLDSNMRRC